MKQLMVLMAFGLEIGCFAGYLPKEELEYIPPVAPAYACHLRYEEGDLPVKTVSTTFTLGWNKKSLLHMDIGSQPLRSVADLYREQNGTLLLVLGEFCGEKFSEVVLPKDPGRLIYSRHSYGPDVSTGNWRTLTLECKQIIH